MGSPEGQGFFPTPPGALRALVLLPAILIALAPGAALASSSGILDSLCSAGTDSLRLGRLEGAARLFEEVLRIDPGSARARSQLGYVHLNLGDLKVAAGLFEQAVRKDPRQAEAFNGLGRAYARTPYRKVDAIRCFQKALSLDRRYAEAQYNLAMTHLDLGNLDAKRAFKEVLRIDPKHPDAHYRLGTVYERHDRDFRGAVSCYEEELAVNPGHVEAKRRLAEAYRKVGRYQDALTMAAELRAQDRRSATRQMLSQALVHLDQRDYGKAQEAFEEFISASDPLEQALYRDLRWVLGREDGKASETGRLFRKYWEWRDPTPLSEFNERLVEHYRRVAHAREHYADGVFPWDRRGDIYVRYGEPDHVSKSDDVRFEMDPKVVAVKDRFLRAADSAVGDLLVDLTASLQRRSRYQGIEVPAQQTAEVRGRPVYPVRPGIRWEYWIYVEVGGGVEFTFTDELGNGRFEYAPVPYDMPLAFTQTWQALHGEHLLEVAMAHQPEYARWDAGVAPLSLACASASFRGEKGKTHFEVYWGVPAEEVASAGDSLSARLWQGLSLFDGDGNPLVRFREEVVAPVATEAGRPGFVPGRMVLAVPGGTYHLVLQVEDPATGRTQARRRDIVAQAYAEKGLEMSDIELAASVQEDQPPGRFTKGRFCILPMASAVFRKGQVVYVYYEVYNLTRSASGGTAYRVAYTVSGKQGRGARLIGGLGRLLGDEKRRGETTITYEVAGTAEMQTGYASLDLTESGAGEYGLRIAVTDVVTGQEVWKEVGLKTE